MSIQNQNHNWLLLIFLFMQTTPPATAQPLPAPPGPISTKKSMAGVMAVVAILFFISGFLSLYTRNCAERRARIRGRLDLSLPIGRSITEPPRGGLHPAVIETFPTFLYATVKGLTVSKETLACAVCLDEFKDDDTLRLIPKCSHVFHPFCIDLWLESHSTCPVCRANLVPRSEDDVSLSPSVAVQFPDDQGEQPNDAVVDDVESSKWNVNLLRRCRTMNLNRTPRSRSTGFLFSVLFPRSNSTGHSVAVEPGENRERFTLRLPEEVRSELVRTTLKRTTSCVSFRRLGSGRKGYRTRSVGSSGRGRNHFCSEEQWGFALTTPFLNRNSSWVESARKPIPVHCSAVASSGHGFGERSSDH